MELISIDNHPNLILAQEWLQTIRQDVFRSESQKRLTRSQWELLLKNKWFKALTPQKYSGLQWTFPEIVAFEEAIGWADGSMGWVFTLCSGAGWFGGFLDPNFAKKIFEDPDLCMAGSGAPSGIAELQQDGTYLISGMWKYASGAPQATIFTANCQIFQNGEPVLLNGEHQVQAFCFLRSEVVLHDTWNQIGLIASAGHSFSVDKLKVHHDRTFSLEAGGIVIQEPLYQLPFMDLAAATIAANYAGMTIHFLEEFGDFIHQKHARKGLISDNTKAMSLFEMSISRLNTSRKDLYTKVNAEWNQLCQKEAPIENSIFDLASILTQTCREIINNLYPYCGLTITNPSTILSQIWRDFQTGSQHALFSPA